MPEYVVFLRGINVGGNKPMKMDALRRELDSAGFENVRTVLTSGNVLFEAEGSDRPAILKQVKDRLKTAFGREVSVILRSAREIADLVDADPFQPVKITPETRLYVTFLTGKSPGSLKAPFETPEGAKVLRVTRGEICAAIELSPGAGTPELMKFIEKEFGRDVTTRNWNTILKIRDKLNP
jgi:uncharacterized protein (DUF1697 family)